MAIQQHINILQENIKLQDKSWTAPPLREGVRIAYACNIIFIVNSDIHFSALTFRV